MQFLNSCPDLELLRPNYGIHIISYESERNCNQMSVCVSKTKEKIIEAFERLTLQLDKGYWREKHTSHHDSHQGKSKLRLFKKYLGKV